MRPKQILIIKPSSLGDIIHSLPMLNSLKKCFPEARIHWVVAKNFEDLLKDHPMIHKLWVIDKDRWKNPLRLFSSIKELLILRKQLKKEDFDLVIDLQGLLRSGLIASFTGSKNIIGFKEAREGSTIFYSHKVEGGREVHAVERYLKTLSVIGCPVREIVFPLPEGSPDINPSSFGDYAVLVLGARWKTKRWPAHNFGELARLLPFKSLVVGGKDELEITEKAVHSSEGKAFSLAGKTDLKGLVEIIRNAKLVVSNDSGPMHIAAALGIPTFAIFGPTSPLRTGPYGKNAIVLKAEIPCAPCFKRKCKDIACMNSIKVEDVWKAISDYFNL